MMGAEEFYEAYLDSLEEIDRLNAALMQAQADLDAANAEAYVGVRIGHWGTRVLRLSALEDLWEARMVPLLDAAGISMAPPWGRVMRHVYTPLDAPPVEAVRPPIIRGYDA